MNIGPDGVWYYVSELPASETAAGWGYDPAPHIHFDIICRDCAANVVFDTDRWHWWNKWYPLNRCTLEECGPTGPQHVAKETMYKRKRLFQYNIIIPDQDLV